MGVSHPHRLSATVAVAVGGVRLHDRRHEPTDRLLAQTGDKGRRGDEVTPLVARKVLDGDERVPVEVENDVDLADCRAVGAVHGEVEKVGGGAGDGCDVHTPSVSVQPVRISTGNTQAVDKPVDNSPIYTCG